MMALRGLLPLSFVGFVALGMRDGVLGVAWPSIRDDFGRSLGELGLVIFLLTAGYFISGLFNGWLTARLGTGRLLVVTSALSTLGALTYAATDSWSLLLAISFLWGTALASVDAGLMAHVALHHGARAMGFLHASYGVGATIGPLLLAAILEAGLSWRGGYLALGVLQAAMTVGYWVTRDRWGAPATSAPRALRRLPRRSLWLGLAVFFFYTGVEVAAGQWGFTLFTEQHGLDEAVAAALVAGYWGSLTVGRLMLGVVGDRMAPEAVVRAATMLVVAALALVWWNPVTWLGGAGLLMAGLGLAPIFPSMVLLTPRRLGEDSAPTTIGFQIAAASVGAASIPGTIGVAIEWVGLGAIGPLLFAGGIGLAIVARAERTHAPT